MKSKKRIWLVFMIFCFAGIICAVYFVRDKEKETAATISKHYIPEKVTMAFHSAFFISNFASYMTLT